VNEVIAAPLGRVLVIGAGACRLAYDLHMTREAKATLALDIDPIALGAASKIISGQAITLTELRSNAVELGRLSAAARLVAPRGRATSFDFLLADGLAPPLRDGAFDTVLTPWFIDLVPPDLRDFMGVVRRVLRPGGRWLNYGPLLYPLDRTPSCRFSWEEILELVRLAGFRVDSMFDGQVHYAHSPLTRRGRIEQVFAFSAERTEGPPEGARPPAWLVHPWLPVPDFEGRASFAHENAGFVAILALVDGRRSIDELADAILARTRTESPRAAVKDAVRYCLESSHPACKR
jgi:SAM-dependent methyltransferase